MNRVIKFRGQTNTNRWVYGDLTQLDDGGCIINGIPVLPETVGQYTGIDDSEGNEIYDGHIYAYFDSEGRHVIVVTWVKEWGLYATLLVSEYFSYRDPDIALAALDKTLYWTYQMEDLTEIKIIGNIHDNPELLNQ